MKKKVISMSYRGKVLAPLVSRIHNFLAENVFVYYKSENKSIFLTWITHLASFPTKDMQSKNALWFTK